MTFTKCFRVSEINLEGKLDHYMQKYHCDIRYLKFLPGDGELLSIHEGEFIVVLILTERDE